MVSLRSITAHYKQSYLFNDESFVSHEGNLHYIAVRLSEEQTSETSMLREHEYSDEWVGNILMSN